MRLVLSIVALGLLGLPPPACLAAGERDCPGKTVAA